MGKEKIRTNPVFWIKMEIIGVNLEFLIQITGNTDVNVCTCTYKCTHIEIYSHTSIHTQYLFPSSDYWEVWGQTSILEYRYSNNNEHL